MTHRPGNLIRPSAFGTKLHPASQADLCILYVVGDQQYFPVYEPSAEDLKARMKEAEGPADEKHYDGNAEGQSMDA